MGPFWLPFPPVEGWSNYNMTDCTRPASVGRRTCDCGNYNGAVTESMVARRMWIWVVLLLRVTGASCVPPPLPLTPIPNERQLKWQSREVVMFLHFGMNTFTDSERGSGKEDPRWFNPQGLDARQWSRVARDAGFSLLILTAKHHDGFCLWPSAYTNHSVASSPWRGGQGDVVKELAHAAAAQGLDMGLYLSPWDRHEPTYGLTLQYNEFYLAQLHELLTNYGPISELWFDGAKPSEAPNMRYVFDKWVAMARALHISANIFSNAGPDLRWIGNEEGVAGSTSWSTINATSFNTDDAGILRSAIHSMHLYPRYGLTLEMILLNRGDPRGTDWVPPECDVSIRKGWFWHKSEKPKSLRKLLDIYFKSVGRNCVMLLGVPPNSSGLIAQEDVERLMEFRKAIDHIFSTNVAANASATASGVRGEAFKPENVLMKADMWSYWAPLPIPKCNEDVICEEGDHWLELRTGGQDQAMKFNVVRIQEAIGMGQRVMKYEVYAGNGRRMELIANGTTIGFKRLHRLQNVVKARSVRIVIKESREVPLVASVGLHLDPFFPAKFSPG